MLSPRNSWLLVCFSLLCQLLAAPTDGTNAAAAVVSSSAAASSSTSAGAAAAAAAGPDMSYSYVIVIDAGSTGTRIHVHPYTVMQPVPAIQPSKSLKVTPGLSSYQHSPREGGESLVKLLEFAKANVPLPLWRLTSIHLKATAGLRSIPEDDARHILEECRRVLHASPFKFTDEQARIITGSEEGIFGWIAANYLEGVFNEAVKPSVGVIEMGGASMQLTFVPADPSEVRPSLLHDVILGGRQFRVYTHSFLNYGLEAAQGLLAQKHAEDVGALHPCYLRKQMHEASNREGSGDFEKCVELIDHMLEAKTCPPESPMSEVCTIEGIMMPKIQGERFYAIENFFYTTKFFGIHEHPQVFEKLKEKGREYCNEEWELVDDKFPNEPTDSLAKYCFSSAYLTRVLEAAFKLDVNPETVRVARNINGVSIDWALGAALFELAAGKAGDAGNGMAGGAAGGSGGPVSILGNGNMVTPPFDAETATTTGLVRSHAAVAAFLTLIICVFLFYRCRNASSVCADGGGRSGGRRRPSPNLTMIDRM